MCRRCARCSAQPYCGLSPGYAMSFPMMASYAALFGLWSMTQFVLVSAWRVASLCNELSDRFLFSFAPSDCSKCSHGRRASSVILDTLRTAAGVPSNKLRRVTFVRENIAGVDPGAGARAVCPSKKWAAVPCTKKGMLLVVVRSSDVVPSFLRPAPTKYLARRIRDAANYCAHCCGVPLLVKYNSDYA